MQRPLLSGSLSFNFDLPFSFSWNIWEVLFLVAAIVAVTFGIKAYRKNKGK